MRSLSRSSAQSLKSFTSTIAQACPEIPLICFQYVHFRDRSEDTQFLNDVAARKPPGFAFVEFEDSRDADVAIGKLDGGLCNLPIHAAYLMVLNP